MCRPSLNYFRLVNCRPNKKSRPFFIRRRPRRSSKFAEEAFDSLAKRIGIDGGRSIRLPEISLELDVDEEFEVRPGHKTFSLTTTKKVT